MLEKQAEDFRKMRSGDMKAFVCESVSGIV